MRIAKKTTALLITASLFASTPVWAETQPMLKAQKLNDSDEEQLDKLSKQARDTVDTLIHAIPQFEAFHVRSVTYSSGAEGEWGVLLSEKPEDGQYKSYADIRLAEEDGSLLSLSVRGDWLGSTEPDEEVAKQAAREFTDQFVQDEYAVAANVEKDSNHRGVVTLYPTVKRIPVMDVWIQVKVDDKGNIVSFDKRQVDFPPASRFADPANIISEDKARVAMSEHLTMRLVFNAKQNAYKYLPSPIVPIDALTGKPVETPYQETTEKLDLPKTKSAIVLKGSAELEKLVEDQLGYSLKLLTMSNWNEKHPDSMPKIVYSFKQATEQAVLIKVDAESKTLEKIEMENAPKPNDDKIVPAENAKFTALKFVQAYVKTDETQLVLKQTLLNTTMPDWVKKENKNGRYTFTFYPIRNGIALQEPLFEVIVNPYTGKVSGFSSALEKPVLTIVDSKVISAEDAKKAFLNQTSLQAVYVYPSYLEQESIEPRVVYLPENDIAKRYINAVTGQNALEK